MNFLFWNLARNVNKETIGKLAETYDVDILMFAEFSLDPAQVLLTLNNKETTYFHSPSINCEKIEIYSRFHQNYSLPIFETPRLTIRKVVLPQRVPFLLAVLHAPSRPYFTVNDQLLEANRISNHITETEEREQIFRTLLVGDLNMNPFESGLVSAGGFHATLSRNIARNIERTVQGKKYRFFYNPMWGLHNDKEESNPPGTYYYSQGAHEVYFWNIFDQVLLRPELIDLFEINSLKIITTNGNISLRDRTGKPDRNISDHLPIFFSLSI